MKMTNSLLAGYTFYKNCPLSYKEKALDDLKSLLTKEFISTEATERGNIYEEKINLMLKQKQPFREEKEQLFEKLYDAQQQGWIKQLSLFTKAGRFTFKGKYDFKLPGHIYDLKTTTKDIRYEKYTKSFQHSIYCLAERVYNFSYIVVKIDNRYHPLESVQIDLSVDPTVEEARLTDVVESMCEDLKELNLWNDYFNIYNKGIE